MLPLKIVSNTINNQKYSSILAKIPLVTNWGWLICFVMISVFNGWMISVSQVEPLFVSADWLKRILVIYFAIFPLAATGHNFFKSTWLLVTSLIGSRAILAFALCYLNFPSLNPLSISFLGFNIFLFVLVLIVVSKTRGIVVPAFILFFTILLTALGLGRWAFHLVWYCNLDVTVNTAGRQLRNALDSFDACF